jgi:hypothetical protein
MQTWKRGSNIFDPSAIDEVPAERTDAPPG